MSVLPGGGHQSGKIFKRILITLAIALLVSTNIWLFVQFLEHDTKITQQEQIIATVSAEKEAVNDQLLMVKNEFATIRTENKGLLNRLASKDSEIKAKVDEIQRLINEGGGEDLRKAREEIAELRKIRDNYVEKEKENKKLKVENQELAGSLEKEHARRQELEEKNNTLKGKIAVGSILKAINFYITPIKLKENAKEVEINKASKVEKLKICFTILENAIAEKGVKDVYIRIITKEGNTLNGGVESFVFKGNSLNYSVKQPLAYNGQDTDYCFFWNYNRPFLPGTYYIEIYCEGNQMAISQLILK